MRSLFPRRHLGAPARRHRVRRTRVGLAFARWRRSSVASLAIAMTAAGVAGVLTLQMLTSATTARDRWGDVVEVAVLTVDVAPGAAIEASSLRDDLRPRHLVPPGALAAEQAVGRVAIAPLVRGEPVVEARVSSDLVPAGWRALAIPAPAGAAHPDVVAGDAVEVLDVGAVDDPAAAEGVVVGVRDDGTATVAVPAEAAARVAYAAVAGSAVIALTAAPPQR